MKRKTGRPSPSRHAQKQPVRGLTDTERLDKLEAIERFRRGPGRVYYITDSGEIRGADSVEYVFSSCASILFTSVRSVLDAVPYPKKSASLVKPTKRRGDKAKLQSPARPVPKTKRRTGLSKKGR